MTDAERDRAARRIESLIDQINHHDHRYYVENDSEISDFEYDQLIIELRDLETQFPDLIRPDSPTQRVSGKPVEEFPVVEHMVTMLSLDNGYSPDDLVEFDRRVRRWLGDEPIEYIAELKIDGIGIALLYEDGSLVRGATRGDGVRGEDVTSNIKTIRSIPLKLNGNSPLKNIEVRGEVFLSKSGFKKLNEEREAKSLPLFANPRNAAAGSVRQLDSTVAASRPLDALFYTLSFAELELETHSHSLEELSRAGMKTSSHIEKFNSIEEVVEHCGYWEERRDQLDYEIDGMVIKINSLEQQRRLGETANHPRWAIAFKFAAKQMTTRLENIVVQVGRTGALTPVAKLTPIEIGGVTVSSATLHNEDEINRKDIRIGDMVLVERAGDVIPELVKSIPEKRDGSERKFAMPKSCPVCGLKVVREEGEAVARCIGSSCPAQLKQKLRHFAYRNAMDIEGLGDAVISQLVDQGIVHTLADIYSLDENKLVNLERLGEKSSRNLLDQISKSKNRGLERLLFGVGIRHIGRTAAENLAARFRYMNEIMAADKEELIEIDGVGDIVAESIVDFFSEPTNRELINELKSHGLSMEASERAEGKLDGKIFVFTGSLSSLSRNEASKRVRELGGKIGSAVTRKTDFVVVGKDPGSKLEEAEKLGIRVLEEKELRRMIED